MSNNISYFELLKWFIIEEWRFFTSLFGKTRFIFFPVMIFIFAISIGFSAPLFDISPALLGTIYFTILILFGLQTGSIGFEAQDSIQDVLGDMSRIIFASKTLPIKDETLVFIFLLKDALFYSVIFLLPIFIGSITGLIITPLGSITLSLSIPLLVKGFILTVISFIFGVSIGFVLTTINIKNIYSVVIFSTIVAFLTVLIQQNKFTFESLSQLSLTYWILGLSTASVILISMGLIQFARSETHTEKSKYKDKYTQLADKLQNKNEYNILIKSLIDIQRSAGGFFKVIFSTATIIITSYALIYFMSVFFGLAARPEYIYSGLFALIGYPLYAIAFRYDSIETYLKYPITKKEVYNSKILLYLILGFPLAIVFYSPLVFGHVTILSAIEGLLVLIGIMLYQLGLLMYLTGDDTSRLLFNGVLFMKYSIATLVVIIPVLMIGMYGQLFTSINPIFVTLYGFIAGLAGVLLIGKKLRDL